ncbi:MAG: FAD-dependent oxidoreductase [Hydrogenophaga sp.]|nr:FAD-dependent oxidoreductase [Hydrogenophaga sp.]
MPASERHAVVVGAGLAGAATAVALCRRGWQVSLLSAGDQVADGASALPVGMLSPHVTRRPTPMSRLTALGVPITRSELERGVPVGQGWQPVEVDNRGHDTGRHPAALVRPGALVQAWVAEALATRRLSLHLGAEVRALERTPAGWRLSGPGGRALAEAGTVVLAAALGCRALTDALGMALPLRPVQGQMSLGPLQGPALAERPQRDDGVFVPEYLDTGLRPRWPERLWSVGSTYRRGATDTTLTEAAHRENLERVQALAPMAGQAMEHALAEGQVMGWAGVRCASLDRLPLIGAAPDPVAPPATRAAGVRAMPRLPGLYLNCALGSRGLALAALAGQTLAALIDGDAMPLDDDLRDAVDPARFAWRQARRGPG